MVPPWIWQDVVRRGLEEDIGYGDLTTDAILDPAQRGALSFRAREPLVVCGTEAVSTTYAFVDARVAVTVVAPDGAMVEAGAPLVRAVGPARALLAGERVALNLMQRLSAIATETRRAVQAVQGTGAQILDTRKTTPGYRALERWATRVGGARNHRPNLHAAVLIKDNHIAAAGGIRPAVAAVKRTVGPTVTIEVEVDRLDQVAEAVASAPHAILFDNMDPETLAQALVRVPRHILTEASGGIRPETVRAYAETGVHAISLGWLTHSARAVDIGADWEDTDGR